MSESNHAPLPEDCTGCNSTGKQHPDCPDCKCPCERCGGAGWITPRDASARMKEPAHTPAHSPTP